MANFMAGCCLFIWDKEKSAFCGRTGRAWGEICGFFFTFYLILLAYFCGLLSIFFEISKDRTPIFTAENSFLKNPGLSIRPAIETSSIHTSLIYMTSDPEEQYTKKAIQSIEKQLEAIPKDYVANSHVSYQNCDVESRLVEKNRLCQVNLQELYGTDCGPGSYYGLTNGQPCVLVAINKVIDWIPEPYTEKDPSMDDHLKQRVDQYTRTKKKLFGDRVFLDCNGADEVDRMFIGNTSAIKYFPEHGFPVAFFPYKNQFGYLRPFIFVKFKALTPNVAVKVHCRIWAKNVKFDTQTWDGGFRFELFYKNP